MTSLDCFQWRPWMSEFTAQLTYGIQSEDCVTDIYGSFDVFYYVLH